MANFHPSSLTIYELTQIVLVPTSNWKSFSNSNATKSHPPTTKKVSSQPWSNAATTPLSHLLAMAKSGNISKVMLRGSILSYLHSSMQSSSSSSSSSKIATTTTTQRRQQRWSETTLPSQNPNILNEIISILLKHGCDDITTLPESVWQRSGRDRLS